MGDISFSASEVAVVAALMASLVAPIGTLFWLLQRAKDTTIERQDKQLTRSETQTDTALAALRDQMSALASALTLMQRDIDGLRSDVRGMDPSGGRRP